MMIFGVSDTISDLHSIVVLKSSFQNVWGKAGMQGDLDGLYLHNLLF